MIELPHALAARLHGVEPIDLALARSIAQRLERDDDELLLHSLIATSEALRHGHSCLLPAAWAGHLHWRDDDGQRPGYRFPPAQEWLAHLAALDIAPDDGQPLVFDRQRLYLRRYWAFETELAAMLRQRIEHPVERDDARARKLLRDLLKDSGNHPRQSLAIANALGRRFSVVTGGPGTGKTYTVTQVLAALQQLHDGKLRMRLAAPTGKAAQRLSESVGAARRSLLEQGRITPEIAARIPDSASTLHRLLGVIPARNDFRHDRHDPLDLDLLLLDEASMIDLPLLTRLLRALPEQASLILLGDANQLPSIAVGSVLADLVAPPPPTHARRRQATHERLQVLLDIDTRAMDPDSPEWVTTLSHSHRFGGAIGALADAVLEGDADNGWRLIQNAPGVIHPHQGPLQPWLERLAAEHYLPIARSQDPDEAFERLQAFRLLATTRVGAQGIDELNRHIETWLRRRLGIPASRRYFHGLPIMVSENHPPSGLYNGDIGLIWETEPGRTSALFPREDGAPRHIGLARLPACETVYAMTVHKTQGSEYRHVALLLPARDNRLLSRELIYTGITRARERLSLHGSEAIWRAALGKRMERHSGLSERLY